jgi:hypothetical protein
VFGGRWNCSRTGKTPPAGNLNSNRRIPIVESQSSYCVQLMVSSRDTLGTERIDLAFAAPCISQRVIAIVRALIALARVG